jgi:hypothetical protein
MVTSALATGVMPSARNTWPDTLPDESARNTVTVTFSPSKTTLPSTRPA